MDDGDIADLALLIHYVAAIEGIDRIRYTTSHPVEFSDSLIEAYATVPELVNHLHLPVQSGSDRILSMMKRGHSTIEYRHKINKLRKIRPDISMSSDFIIGFPGETDADFDATMKLIDDIGFDASFSFIYSLHPVPRPRLCRMMSVWKPRSSGCDYCRTSCYQTNQISRRMVGSQRILVEGYRKSEELRTENNRAIN